jgi:hypothetical protein
MFNLFMNCHFAHAEATNAPSQQETNAPAQRKTNSPAQETPPPPAKQETNALSKLDYSSFKIIADRNIFNPNRSSRSGRSRATQQTRAKVDSFALVGTLSSGKGSFAFFDSTSSQYKKVLKRADTIAGYRVKEIAPNHVKLESGGKEIELRVGNKMRRQDGGEWRLAGQAESSASTNESAASAESTASISDDEANDVLTKLMKQREEELNK